MPTDLDPPGALGLTAADVAERVRLNQINRVKTESSRSLAAIVRSNVFTRVNALLGSLFAVILVVGPLQDALFGGVLIANTLIGIVQEWRVKRALDRLRLVSTPEVRVIRDGATLAIPPAEVVLDDIVLVGRGDQVVTDGEVIASDGLELDESLLTGESDPQPKPPGARVVSGSAVLAGTGHYRAGPVGEQAYAHQIAASARTFTTVHSELTSGINRILTWITWAIVPASAVLIVGQTRSGLPWRDAATGAVAGLVVMVPEGLVLLTSASFAVSGIRLARRKAFIQELPAVEGLARVDVVCIDKTGTLTEGVVRLAGVAAIAPGRDGATPLDDVLAALGRLPEPNAAQAAIAAHYPHDPGWRAARVVPFSSARRWSGATFDAEGSFVLGAPEVVLDAAEHGARDAASELAATGARVLALSRSTHALDGEQLPAERQALALVQLDEQLRGDAADTLAYFARQGVEVKVISGDNPRTVAAIANRLGLAGEAIDAHELPTDLDALADAVDRITIFGRVEPHQKVAIVEALQRRGHVVAMTGDGVNDVLALKRADLGIAMGSGAPAVRAVAQLVLVDNRFSSLPAVVAEGRRVLANIEKLALLFLTKTVYAVLFAFVIGLSAAAYPFLPRHLTLVNAVTIGIPAFILSFAPNPQRYLAGFVRRVSRRAVPLGMIVGIATLATFAVSRHYAALDESRTIALIALLTGSFAVLTITSRPLTGYRVALIGTMAALTLAAFAIPAARDFFALYF